MQSSKIQILMATMGRNYISDIDWTHKNTKCDILVVNQANKLACEKSENVTMLSCLDRGSSNSRNMAINNATGEICLFADDDVAYVDDMENIIKSAFDQHPDADIITFQIVTPEGNLFNSGYPEEKLWHNFRSILRCASIEIAFRRESIVRSALRLDTNFGLGSKYRVHDEIIFLKDALDKGLRILYVPVPIVIHPAESSGTNFTEHLVFSKGAAFVRLFGWKGVFLNIVFAIKKYPRYRKEFSIFRFIWTEFKGSASMIKLGVKK